MLSPKRFKYKKAFKGRVKGNSKRGTDLFIGDYGLKALGEARISSRQIESARRALTRHMKRLGEVWIKIFPDVPVSRKPAEVRMGSGKGSVDRWVCRVSPGRILFEVGGVSEEVALEALRLGAAKLPLKSKVISRKNTVF